MADQTSNLKILISASNQSQAAFSQINNSLNGLKTAFAGVVTALAGGFAFKNIIDSTRAWGQQVDMLQDQLGGTAAEMSKLNFIGQSVGLTTEDLSQTFGILNKRIADSIPAIMQGTSEFDKWGISLRDGAGGVVGFDEAMRRIKTRFQEVGQGAQGTALLLDVFGRSGKTLSDFLALTDEQMQGMIKDAQDFGLVLDGKASAALEQFDRDMYRFGLQVEGVKLAIGQALLPILSGFLEKIRQGSGWLKVFAEAVKYVSGIAKEVAAAIGRLLETIGERGLLGALKQFGGDIGAIVLKVLGDIGKKLDSLGPLGEIAKDALIALGALKVIGAIEGAITAIGNIALALKKLPVRTVLAIDVVLVGLALEEVDKTIHVISDHWEDWRRAAHEGALEMQGDSNDWGRLTVKRAVEWGDFFDSVGTLTQKRLKEWGAFWSDYGTIVHGVWDTVVAAVKGAFESFVDGIRNSINTTIANLNQLINAINSLPGPDLPNISFLPEPQMPGQGKPGKPFAEGGIVMRPTNALIGESGPEAVIPLGRNGGMGLAPVINVYVAGSVLSEHDLLATLNDRLMRNLFSQRKLNY